MREGRKEKGESFFFWGGGRGAFREKKTKRRSQPPLTKETPDPAETGANVATKRAAIDVSSAAHVAANRAASATPCEEKPRDLTIEWMSEFLRRSPPSTAAPREAARQPVPRPMAAVAASLKSVCGLILRGGWGRVRLYWGGGGGGRK